MKPHSGVLCTQWSASRKPGHCTDNDKHCNWRCDPCGFLPSADGACLQFSPSRVGQAEGGAGCRSTIRERGQGSVPVVGYIQKPILSISADSRGRTRPAAGICMVRRWKRRRSRCDTKLLREHRPDIGQVRRPVPTSFYTADWTVEQPARDMDAIQMKRANRRSQKPSRHCMTVL